MDNLEQEIQLIKERNKKVEIDKAWETSIFRKIIITILTYFVIVIFFIYAELSKPFINAVVPTIGFMVSTLSLPLFKKIWLKHINKNN